MTPNYELAEKIRQRLESGLSQRALAIELGVTQSCISACCKAHGIKWPRQYRQQDGELNSQWKGGNGRSTIERLTRRILLEAGRQLNKCERCGWECDYQELPKHHKDHNRGNNTLENLEIVCWSCHNVEHNQKKPRNDLGQFTCTK